MNADAIRARCSTLHGFVKEAWHVLEPGTPFVDGWVIQCICAHLEAVSRGQINRLRINVPPGMMKSLLASVFWQAWEWGPFGRPDLRYFTSSWKEDYAKRDARKTRDLIASDWFQDLWGDRFVLTRSAEMSFENSNRGTREAVVMNSMTGGRGDRVCLDDPHSTETAESETERATTTRIFRESIQNRLNDQVRSAIVVIMQRLHSNDVSGIIDQLKLPFVNVILPMEFEPENRCETVIGFRDPRSYAGELLFPERFPRDAVEALKVSMGSYAYAGQYQQRPAPREGGMFQRHWFGVVGAAPVDTVWVRHWDLAASTRSNSAYTSGVKLGRAPNGMFFIGNVIRERLEGFDVRRLIVSTAAMDGPECEISLPQDPGQAGKVQAQDWVNLLAGYRVHVEAETGSKEDRAEPAAVQAEGGNMQMVRGEWNEAFLAEATLFPNSPYKDQIDALSGAFGRFVLKKKGFVMTSV